MAASTVRLRNSLPQCKARLWSTLPRGQNLGVFSAFARPCVLLCLGILSLCFLALLCILIHTLPRDP
ncbi:hypothetical protein RJT34_09064 [Clitoria ternatea]|uniref:Uncharacterized protein n=1 Tax=Clitoria ternatea TaxID=43366 RepID=A0AAN9K7T7_CLITE